jgi:hypothetical protein
MTRGLHNGRLVALLFLPLTTAVAATLIVRPLLAPELRTAWPIFAGALTVAAFALVATMASQWTRRGTAAALVTLASVGATLVGFYLLLLWALTSTWG